MARVARARCADCGTSPASMLAHIAGTTHRARVARRNDARTADIIGAEERAAWSRSMRAGTVDAEERALEAAAMAGDATHEPYWLGVAILAAAEDPRYATDDPGEGTAVELPENEKSASSLGVPTALPTARPAATRGYRPPACDRCGRDDFRTDKGRAWHLENNPDCAKSAGRKAA